MQFFVRFYRLFGNIPERYEERWNLFNFTGWKMSVFGVLRYDKWGMDCDPGTDTFI